MARCQGAGAGLPPRRIGSDHPELSASPAINHGTARKEHDFSHLVYLQAQLVAYPFDISFLLLRLTLYACIRFGIIWSVAVRECRSLLGLFIPRSIILIKGHRNGRKLPTCLALNLALLSFFGAWSRSLAISFTSISLRTVADSCLTTSSLESN